MIEANLVMGSRTCAFAVLCQVVGVASMFQTEATRGETFLPNDIMVVERGHF